MGNDCLECLLCRGIIFLWHSQCVKQHASQYKDPRGQFYCSAVDLSKLETDRDILLLCRLTLLLKFLRKKYNETAEE